jgi:hypothetical protein
MLDIAVAYNRYKFIGHEFLTWLWFSIENEERRLIEICPDLTAFEIGNRLVLENRINDGFETITIKGDDAGLEEGIMALAKGAMVTELNLIFLADNQKWRFSIKGENLSLSSIKVPETGPVENKEDMEGLVLEKAFLYEKVFATVDSLFNFFILLRLSNKWQDQVMSDVRSWIQSK